MSRVIVNEREGARTASSLVDLDGLQALVTLCATDEGVAAEIRFRTGPGEDFSEPVQLGDASAD